MTNETPTTAQQPQQPTEVEVTKTPVAIDQNDFSQFEPPATSTLYE